jgi:tellurite resistance protein
MKIPIIPAAYFGMVLGLAGLGASWRAAAQLWALPPEIGEAIMAVAVAVWAILLVLFALKWLIARADALEEAAHPVLCCFIGLAGVATMLAAGAILPYSHAAAEIIGFFGMAFTLLFAVWRQGGLWQGGRDPATSTAVLYLPSVAGSFVSAIIASALGHADWGQVIFGAGFFSWLAIESVLIHRLLTSPATAEALRPTLGVQIAPAPVGLLAYLAVTPGQPDLPAHMLLGYGLLQTLIVLRLLPWIRKAPFAASYWAFTFGITALATGPIRLALRGDSVPAGMLAPALFVFANLVVGLVASGTLWLLVRGQLNLKWTGAPVAVKA